MAAQSPKVSSLLLLLMWGVLGAMAACCVLWVILGTGGHAVEFILDQSRSLLLKFGFASGYLTEIAMLHLQFAGLGFVVGSGFRFLGLRQQLADRREKAA